MGFEWLMDTHKMTLFTKKKKKKKKKKLKKIKELERSRWNMPQYHEVSTVTYQSLFSLYRVQKTCFFQPIVVKNAI